MPHLTEKNESFCSTTGFIGLGLSITCLLQLFFFMNSHWIIYPITAVYIFSIISFSLLIKQNRYAPLILVISSILLFLTELWLFIALAFSLIVILTLLYSIIITVLIYIDNLPEKLKLQALDKKAEENYWNDKV